MRTGPPTSFSSFPSHLKTLTPPFGASSFALPNLPPSKADPRRWRGDHKARRPSSDLLSRLIVGNSSGFSSGNMGAETMSSDEAIYGVEDGELSDAAAFSFIIGALDGVRTASHMISQEARDQYDNLISIVDPEKKLDPDDRTLFVMVLEALSEAVSKIDPDFHGSLLSNIFDMSIWNYEGETREALLGLVTSLAAVPDKFLDGCLHMLVSNFLPPRRLRQSIIESRWLERRKEAHGQLHKALHYITDIVPLAPMKLKDFIDRRMPRHTDPKEVILLFVECMLGLESDEIWEFLGSTLLAKVVDLLMDLDVNISWEDILQDDHNKGIFDMELEDAQEDGDVVERIGTMPRKENEGALKGNACAEKLDGLMVIMCEHLKSCSCDGHLVKTFELLTESFRRTVLNAYKSKFAQFVIFYACSLDPEKCGKKFADLLTDIFVSSNEDPISRMSAVGYLASYLSRAKFISSHLAADKLKRLVDWCFKYCQFQNGREISINPEAHRIFYSGCQAVMYVLCFRMRSIIVIPELKSLLFHLPLEQILCHPLDPLKVCLPTIVHEFLRQTAAARLFNTSMASVYDNLSFESALSKAFGGLERLDMFFPFDPYLLKESDRFMRPNFEFWFLVKTTYSDFSSEDEDEDEDLDGPYTADDARILEDHETLDPDSEGGDDLEYSLDKMSITPKPVSDRSFARNHRNPVQMPARLRPSVSPNW